MRKIMILSGGTGSAWHIANVVKKFFKNVKLYICDVNPKHLVHSSIMADEYFQIPFIKDSNYENHMYKLFEDTGIDILMPLIDDDVIIFCKDNEILQKLNILSTAPNSNVSDTLTNKKNLNAFLNKIAVDTPRLYSLKDVAKSKETYFVKDVIGYGSKNSFKETGNKIDIDENEVIIQEMCQSPEITVDVLKHNDKIYTICRKRIEIKSGVTVKAKVYYDSEIQNIIEKISKHVEFPNVFCVQFMKNKFDKWTLTDFNLRPGAGTAMSSAVGFELIRAALAIWLKEDNEELITSLLNYPEKHKYILRAYEEIVIDENNYL